MQAIQNAAATNTPAPLSSAVPANEQINTTDFMSMLTAELQNQDPTNPLDPSQFVSQLVQLNSLEQLASINQELAPSSSPSPSSAGAPVPAQS
ncbi:MAG: flagellar hook capping FlgD N-terminal domain-containing protein [Terriglobales bacterium]